MATTLVRRETDLRPWVVGMVRLGYVAKGTIYLLAWTDRVLTIIKGVVYGAVGWEAMRLVLGARGRSQNADDYARDIMKFPLGTGCLRLSASALAYME